MAWSHTTNHTIIGVKRMRWGTFTNTSGTSGGAIETGLNTINSYAVEVTEDPAGFTQVTTSKSVGTITVTTDTNAAITGDWWAIGL